MQRDMRTGVNSASAHGELVLTILAVVPARTHGPASKRPSAFRLGFVTLGVFAFTIQGLSGGILTMINHGLSTGALFLLVGMLYERTHTRDLRKMGGLASIVPVYAGVLLFVALSSIGLPGLNGFVGEFLVILGTFVSTRPFAIAAVTGVVLSAIYLLWGYQRLMHGPPAIAGGAGNGHTQPSSGARTIPKRPWDLELREYFVVVPIMAAILFIGIFPKPLLSTVRAFSGRCFRSRFR